MKKPRGESELESCDSLLTNQRLAKLVLRRHFIGFVDDKHVYRDVCGMNL
jgi:hypothetical protein